MFGVDYELWRKIVIRLILSCLVAICLAGSLAYAKAPAKKEPPPQVKMVEEGTAAYKTKGGEVFSCKTINGKVYFASCRSARELDDKSVHTKWCEGGQVKEVLVYQTDLGQFECPIDRGADRCTELEYEQNPKFCAVYGQCTVNSREHPKDQSCFNQKTHKVKKKR